MWTEETPFSCTGKAHRSVIVSTTGSLKRKWFTVCAWAGTVVPANARALASNTGAANFLVSRSFRTMTPLSGRSQSQRPRAKFQSGPPADPLSTGFEGHLTWSGDPGVMPWPLFASQHLTSSEAS